MQRGKFAGKGPSVVWKNKKPGKYRAFKIHVDSVSVHGVGCGVFLSGFFGLCAKIGVQSFDHLIGNIQ